MGLKHDVIERPFRNLCCKAYLEAYSHVCSMRFTDSNSRPQTQLLWEPGTKRKDHDRNTHNDTQKNKEYTHKNKKLLSLQ